MSKLLFISKLFLPWHSNTILITVRIPLRSPNISQGKKQQYDFYESKYSKELRYVVRNSSIKVEVINQSNGRLDAGHVIIRIDYKDWEEGRCNSPDPIAWTNQASY